MEKLYGIPAVLVIIYKNLSFADQLVFASVNSFLRNIFENFIFPIKYSKLKITTIEDTENFLVSNEMDENCMLLTHKEVRNFLQFGADEIEEMHVSSECYKYPYICQLPDFSCVEDWLNLRNLTCFHYENLTLCDKHFLLIAEKYPKLGELRLIYCKNRAHREDLVVGRGLSISTVARLKQLKTLIVKSESVATIGMSLFCELITNVPLECLKLKAALKYDMHYNLITKKYNNHLKELEIDFDDESLKFFKRTGILKNLIKLNVNQLHDVKDSVFRTITKACEKLECLKIDYDGNFKTITHFQLPPNLKELSIGEGASVGGLVKTGLNHIHIIDILTKFKIEKFTCRFVADKHVFKDLKISPYLKVLDLKGIKTVLYLSSSFNNNTLKELHWYEYEQNFPHNHECLKACENLEKLIIEDGFIPLDVIFELKQLHILQLLRSLHHQYHLHWSYIIGLLKHPSLKELYIDDSFSLLYDAENFPAKGFPSAVTLVYIYIELFVETLDFWLDMLHQNPTILLKSEITPDWYFVQPILKKLIQHDNFPMDLREIEVCGFNLNCEDLRKNFSATIHPLEQAKNSISIDTLVLSRKQT